MKKPHARERILNTAADLFTKRGYGVVGINEIIAKSETAKASFYHHFPSKENLCLTWLEETHRRSEARHLEILKAPGAASDKVLAYFLSLREWMEARDFRGCPFTNTIFNLDQESPDIAELVERHKRSIRDFFTDLAGEITPLGMTSQRLGNLLFLLYAGATTEAQNLKSTWPIEAAMEGVRDLMDHASTPPEVT